MSYVRAGDLDFTRDSNTEFPEGWRSAEDLIAAFLLIGSLELQGRKQLSPGDPFAPWVLGQLPPEFQWDPFGSLVRYGDRTNNDMLSDSGAVSSNPAVNQAYHGWKLDAGERIGRYPLIGLVWRLVDDVVAANEHLRIGDRVLNYQTHVFGAGSALAGLVLGQHGIVLFFEAFNRRWFKDGDDRNVLTPTEIAYLEGSAIPGFRGQGLLAAAGHMYEDPIWNTTFRLIERQSPERFIRLYGHRTEIVMDILRRGALLGPGRTPRQPTVWPGWPR